MVNQLCIPTQERGNEGTKPSRFDNNSGKSGKYLICILVISGLVFLAGSSWGQPFSLPSINLSVGDGGDEPGKVAVVLQLLFLLTTLSLAPAILVMLTSHPDCRRPFPSQTRAGHAADARKSDCHWIVSLSDLFHHDPCLE